MLSILAVAGLSVLAACSQQPVGGPSGDTSTPSGTGLPASERRSWVLDAAKTGDPTLSETIVTIFLADGNLSAQLSCNDAGGAFSWDNDQLVLGDNFAETLVGCPDQDAVNKVDAIIRSQPHVTVEGSIMTMTSPSNEHVVFHEIDDDRSVQQADLAGRWTVVPPGGGDAAPGPVTFDPNGNYQVTVGCTNRAGQLSVRDGRVTHPSLAAGLATNCTRSPTTTPSENLVNLVLSAVHVRRVGQGLEMLDMSGVPIARLQP